MKDQTVRVLGRSEAKLGRVTDSYPPSVVIFDAETLDGQPVQIAVDVRMAGPIERDLSLGDGPAYAIVDEWQVFRLATDGQAEVRY